MVRAREHHAKYGAIAGTQSANVRITRELKECVDAVETLYNVTMLGDIRMLQDRMNEMQCKTWCIKNPRCTAVVSQADVCFYTLNNSRMACFDSVTKNITTMLGKLFPLSTLPISYPMKNIPTGLSANFPLSDIPTGLPANFPLNNIPTDLPTWFPLNAIPTVLPPGFKSVYH